MDYFCADCGHEAMKTGKGLGTWRCARCPYVRTVKVTRVIGSGHENERGGRIEEVPVRRHIRVVRRARVA